MTFTRFDIYLLLIAGVGWFVVSIIEWIKGSRRPVYLRRSGAVGSFIMFLFFMLDQPNPMVLVAGAFGLAGSVVLFFIPRGKRRPSLFDDLGSHRYIYWALMLLSIGIMMWGAAGRTNERYWMGLIGGLLGLLLAQLYVYWRHNRMARRA